MAAVLGGDPDSTDLHLADTLAAGAGLCDVDAVRVLVDEGPGRVQDLIALGAVFDRDADGGLALAREGGHSVARVVHAGGAATGAEIERALVDAVQATAASVMEGWFALDLLVEDGRCRGVVALDPSGAVHEVRARHTLLATGGAGQLFAVTTNPAEATGDGVAMALRAGVAVADLEFVQFHPTALHHPPDAPAAAVGGAAGPRRPAARRRTASASSTSWRPATWSPGPWPPACSTRASTTCGSTPPASTASPTRFPTIAAALAGAGLDPATDWLPIAPAAHYTSAAWSPTSTAPPPCPGCGPRARWPAPASTAPTAWPPTRCSRAWCSRPGWWRPSSGGKDGPERHRGDGRRSLRPTGASPLRVRPRRRRRRGLGAGSDADVAKVCGAASSGP